MIWSLNLDDFKGECSNTGQNWFPLITKVKSVPEEDPSYDRWSWASPRPLASDDLPHTSYKTIGK
jgi:hypothetical protein